MRLHACPSHGQKRAARNAVVALAGVVSPQSHVQASSNSACAVIRRMPLTKKDVYAIVKKHELDGSRRGLLLNVVCALDNEDLERRALRRRLWHHCVHDYQVCLYVAGMRGQGTGAAAGVQR